MEKVLTRKEEKNMLNINNKNLEKFITGKYGNEFEMVKVREKYHNPEDDVICITAGKTRLIEVYNNILTGKKLDKRGKIK